MNKTLSSLIGLGAVLALGAGAAWVLYSGGPGGWFCSGYGRGYGSGGYGMMGGGMGGGMFILWIIGFIGIALLIGKLAVGSDPRRHNAADDNPDALEILKLRYARGEIDKAEYMARRQDLTL